MSEPVFNKIYGVFWYKENGQPPLLIRECRSLKHAVLTKLKCIEDNGDYNIRIMVRDVSDWYFMEDDYGE